MSATLSILNHYKTSVQRGSCKNLSNFVDKSTLKADTSSIDWESVLSYAFDVVSQDTSLKSIIEEEGYQKSTFLTNLKDLYKSIFDKDILSLEICHFNHQVSEKDFTTQSHSPQHPTILDFTLDTSNLKLIKESKIPTNLSVHSYNVTLIQEFITAYTGFYKPQKDAKDQDGKEVKNDYETIQVQAKVSLAQGRVYFFILLKEASGFDNIKSVEVVSFSLEKIEQLSGYVQENSLLFKAEDFKNLMESLVESSDVIQHHYNITQDSLNIRNLQSELIACGLLNKTEGLYDHNSYAAEEGTLGLSAILDPNDPDYIFNFDESFYDLLFSNSSKPPKDLIFDENLLQNPSIERDGDSVTIEFSTFASQKEEQYKLAEGVEGVSKSKKQKEDLAVKLRIHLNKLDDSKTNEGQIISGKDDSDGFSNYQIQSEVLATFVLKAQQNSLEDIEFQTVSSFDSGVIWSFAKDENVGDLLRSELGKLTKNWYSSKDEGSVF